MPWPGPRRPIVSIRLSVDGRDWIDQRALSEGLTSRNGEPQRSEMIRIMLAYASANMPRGWRP